MHVEETVDRRRGCQRNGESVGRARCEDCPLGCFREAVPTARLPVRFALCCDNRAEGLCILHPRCYLTEDSHYSRLILGCGLVGGFLTFQVAFLPLAETACRALVRSQRERCRLNSWCFERYLLNKLEGVVAIVCNSVRSVARRRVFC